MGVIIPWPKQERHAERSPVSNDGERGRILLFLGVRYERHDENAPAPDSAGGATRGAAERRQRARRRV